MDGSNKMSLNFFLDICSFLRNLNPQRYPNKQKNAVPTPNKCNKTPDKLDP